MSAMLASLTEYIEPRSSAGYAPGARGAGSTICICEPRGPIARLVREKVVLPLAVDVGRVCEM